MKLLVTILTSFGSIVSIGFGIWHFFVPRIWNWYSYIEPTATELVIAVRAINIFFSLSLVLLGIANLLIVFKNSPDKFSLMVMLSVSVILWATRTALQFIYPQGSQNPVLQYAMLAIFLVVFCCFLLSLLFVWMQKM
ncbi:MAG: hypothetical protein HYZ14_10285 [Bacteroidetes bacterium]|nr:hypothetical protein [Bacteroidota bacterium]